MSELLLAGANMDSRDCDGFTPLHVASRHNCLGVVEQLLAANAKVNILDSSGGTPLKLAARNGHVDVVRALLRRGKVAWR